MYFEKINELGVEPNKFFDILHVSYGSDDHDRGDNQNF